MRLLALAAGLALIAVWVARHLAFGRTLRPTMADDIRTAQRHYDEEYLAEEQRRRAAWTR